MRALVLVLLLALPATALADGPCGPAGTNVPLTAVTRPPGRVAETPEVVSGPNAVFSGSLRAVNQAYPH